MDEMIGKTCTVGKVGREIVFTEDEHKYFWHWADLELVRDRKAAQILTEKVIICNVPCRKILGFEGILRRDELPEKYTNGRPSFWFVARRASGAHVFDGHEMSWEGPSGSNYGLVMNLPIGTRIGVGDYCFTGMNVGDVWPETTFQELLTWLKRAGSRLAKIRTQEKAAWSGKETVEI
jgi:hypothetical protein